MASRLGLRTGHPQGPGQQVALGMVHRFLGRNRALAQKLPGHRVVLGQLLQPASTHQVQARITDVEKGQQSAAHDDRGEGRAHALRLVRFLQHAVLGLLEGPQQELFVFSEGHLPRHLL